MADDVRELIERTDSICAVWRSDETYGLTESEWRDFRAIRDELDKQTDPNPLTVEVLLSRGGVRSSEKSVIKYQGFWVWCCSGSDDPSDWDWSFDEYGLREITDKLVPRTVGELNQLERRIRT